MEKILIVSVGGSPEPILTACETLKPNRIIFFCSKDRKEIKGSQDQIIGEGKPCVIHRNTPKEEKLPNIPTQLKLEDNFDVIVVEDSDDFDECYRLLTEKVEEIRTESREVQFQVDYTGGTKTMSAALALLGMDEKMEIYMTGSQRKNIVKTEYGQRTKRVEIPFTRANRPLKNEFARLIENYDYASLSHQIESSWTTGVPETLRLTYQKLDEWSQGFDCWDRFKHEEALQYLKSYSSDAKFRNYVLALKRVIDSRKRLLEGPDAKIRNKIHGYELIDDLLLNVERREIQNRYDDAVLRIYRAMELLAQTQLRLKYKQKSGDIDVENLPDALKGKYEEMRSDKKIKLALDRSYQLLADLGDPLGAAYQDKKDIWNKLALRNNLFFVHDWISVSRREYFDWKPTLLSFIKEAQATLIKDASKYAAIPQFPNNIEFFTETL